MINLTIRNAYMIMAHNNWSQLKLLISLLDDTYNDFYIHIDSKVKNVDMQDIKKAVKYSKVYFTRRISIRWGGYGTIEASMILLEAATKLNYDYYHLMSGNDLPLKSNQTINDFLVKNMYENNSRAKMTNYMTYGLVEQEIVRARVSHYNILVPFFRCTPKCIGVVCKKINAMAYHVQRNIGIDRIKKYGMKLYKGSIWYIISHECANFLLENRGKGKKLFGHFTFSGDEFVLQTLVVNSYLKDTLYHSRESINSNLYEIDWELTKGDGSPHLFTMKDVEKLENSENFYARKFDVNVDEEIVKYITKKCN